MCIARSKQNKRTTGAVGLQFVKSGQFLSVRTRQEATLFLIMLCCFTGRSHKRTSAVSVQARDFIAFIFVLAYLPQIPSFPTHRIFAFAFIACEEVQRYLFGLHFGIASAMRNLLIPLICIICYLHHLKAAHQAVLANVLPQRAHPLAFVVTTQDGLSLQTFLNGFSKRFRFKGGEATPRTPRVPSRFFCFICDTENAVLAQIFPTTNSRRHRGFNARTKETRVPIHLPLCWRPHFLYDAHGWPLG